MDNKETRHRQQQKMAAFSIDAILRSHPSPTKNMHVKVAASPSKDEDEQQQTKLQVNLNDINSTLPMQLYPTNVDALKEEDIDVDGEDDADDVIDSHSMTSSPISSTHGDDENEENDYSSGVEYHATSSTGPHSMNLNERGALSGHPLLTNGQHPAFRNIAQGFHPFGGNPTIGGHHPAVAMLGGHTGGAHALSNSAFRAPALDMQRHALHIQQMQLEWLARSNGMHPSRYVDYHGKFLHSS